MPQSSNRKGERARSPKGIELKEAKANRSRRSRQRSHRRRKRHSSSSRRRRRGRHRFRGDHSDESYSSNGDTSEGSYLTSSSDSDAEPSETEVVIPQSTRKVLSSLKAKMKSKRSKKDTSPQQNKDTPPSPRNNTAKQIGTATAKFFAVAGFKAAGKRQQIKRTELGTALGRAGTGIHSTLSNIRSDKGRARHRKFLQSEEKGVLVRPKGVFLLFSEDDNFKKIWTVVILFLVVYTSINIPLQFGFPYDEENPVLDYLIDALFICDIAICFRTAYVNDAGDEVFDLVLIRRNYMKLWFWIDVVACFPAEVFILLTRSEDSRAKIMLRLLKTPRLFRIGRLFKYLNQFQYAAVWRLLRLVVALLFVSHWVACLYIFICRLEVQGGSQVWPPFYDLQSDSTEEQYMFSLLTAFLMLIGEGIDPETLTEQAFVFTSSVLGAIMMAVIIGNISLVLQNANALSSMFQSKMDVISDSMRAMNISPRLQRKTLAYYELLWKRQRALTTRTSFIDELSPPLRKELNMDLNTEVIYRCDLFKRLLDRDDESLANMMTEETSDHILVAIINALQREVFLPGDTIIQQGEIGEEMFFLVRGLISIEKMVCNEIVGDDGREKREYVNQEIAQLKAGAYFGELALLRDGDRSKQRRAASCIAMSDCDVRILNKDPFKKVCDDFPQLRKYLRKEAERKYVKFSKNPPSSAEENIFQNDTESKAGPPRSPSKTLNLRRDSISMALSQSAANIDINEKLRISNEISSRQGKTGSVSITSPAVASSVADIGASKGDILALQKTLDTINSRLSRLEVNLGRLGKRGDGSTGNISSLLLANIKPPTPRGLIQPNSAGSAGRRLLTSPAASVASSVSPKSGSGSSNRGWGALRKNVVGQTSPVAKMQQSPRRLDSGFSWT